MKHCQRILAVSKDWGDKNFNKKIRELVQRGFAIIPETDFEPRVLERIFREAYDSVIFLCEGRVSHVQIKDVREKIREILSKKREV